MRRKDRQHRPTTLSNGSTVATFLLALIVGTTGVTCRSETAIVVTVDTQDVRIPDSMDRIRIVVTSPNQTVEKSLVSGELTGTEKAYSATIMRTSSSVKKIEVRAIGLKGDRFVGESELTEIAFKEHEVVRKTVGLNVIVGCRDEDGDGFSVGLGCPTGIETDCDDGDEHIYPGAPERCNGKDDNCDENHLVDENVDVSTSTCPPRQGVCAEAPISCVEGEWDCGDPPGYSDSEICGDMLDNNCDGTVDEGCSCDPESIGEPCGTDEGECEKGTMECVEDQLVCTGGLGPQPELCNSLDDNCDGQTDEGFGVGDTCVTGMGNCQSAGTYVCAADGSGVECDTGGQVIEPSPENCNDPNTQDEDCDGESNESDPDCELLGANAKQCYWFFETSSENGQSNLCTYTLEVPLRAFASGDLQNTVLWTLEDETCPGGITGCSSIADAEQSQAMLVITFDETAMFGSLKESSYLATVHANLVDSDSEIVAYYEIPIEVPFCEKISCTNLVGFYECVSALDPDEEPVCPGAAIN